MKWGFATTAAIVRSLQKDLFYRKQLQDDLKLILFDYLPVGWVLKIEDDWLPLIVDCFYFGVLTGCGQRTLGESYSHLIPVDIDSRNAFLKNKLKRILWVILNVLVPFLLKKVSSKLRIREIEMIVDILEPANKILLYSSGKFPTVIHKLFSIRYIFYPRKPPMLDEDSVIYKGLGAVLGIITIKKLIDLLNSENIKQIDSVTSIEMKESHHKYKCPVCYDHLEGASFASIKCGHVYCWHCISRWMSTEQNCPVCRVSCDPPDLIPLANLK